MSSHGWHALYPYQVANAQGGLALCPANPQQAVNSWNAYAINQVAAQQAVNPQAGLAPQAATFHPAATFHQANATNVTLAAQIAQMLNSTFNLAAVQVPAVPPVPQHFPDSNKIVVCVVCGGLIKPTVPSALADRGSSRVRKDWMHAAVLVKALPEFDEWSKRASRSRQSLNAGDKLLQELHVTEFHGSARHFFVRELPGKVAINTDDQEIAIPAHTACLDVVRVFCNYQGKFNFNFRASDGGAPSSMAHFYEIWRNRALATCLHGGIMRRPIKEPNDGYLGAPALQFKDLVGYAEVWQKSWQLRRFEACPIFNPVVITKVILSKLSTMDGKSRKPDPVAAEAWARTQALPVEICDLVLLAMEPFESRANPMSLTPTRALPNKWWKDSLMSGCLIPWLWDLDSEEVAKHERLACRDEEDWDWELLCRRLAQPQLVHPGGKLHGFIHLWNRRRIWKLLDLARLGHVTFGH
ncbi:Uu.00g027370.m01.CDS01 [Anthostomella pinea]|uniref:Uu.00g027370.m01.CDS01 n=1 Tax=Anthostomella pinea TaxID=933095 RepID=A0AAI8V7K7_9PEZI|nr:Uu.00g027370.m01.CDS01 [Anthostomella pinea]